MNKELMEELLNEEEGSALDFKRDQYLFDGATDEQKSELLKDILAFANSWRRTDAYILIGVEEIKGERSKVVGISKHFDDANLQQFVNSKTQQPTTFSYKVFSFEGAQVGVIRIPIQDRPIYLKKDFGKLKKNVVYVRRGSSTAEADPTEIARMGTAAIQERQEPRLVLQFTDLKTQTLLGTALTLESEVVELPKKSSIPDARKDAFDWMTNSDYYVKKAEYIAATSLLNAVGFAVENKGDFLAINPRLVVIINKEGHLVLLDKWKYPKRPQIKNIIMPPPLGKTTNDVFVNSQETRWILTADFSNVQPKATVGTRDSFYIGATESCKLELLAKVYADNLSDPIQVQLTIEFTTKSRKLSIRELTRGR